MIKPSSERRVLGAPLSRFLATLSLALALPLAAQAQDKVLKAGTSMAPDHPAAQLLDTFARELRERSDGKLTMTVHHSGVLGGDMQQQQQLQAGTQDVMTTGTATMAGQIKEISILDFPFLFQSGEEFDQTMDGPLGQTLSDKAFERGWVVLAYTHNGFRNTTNSRHPVARWEDFDGLKLRVIQNAMYVDMFKRLGANPTPMAVTEVYTALETGAVDGQENPLAQIVTMRMQEVQKYLSMTRHSINSEALMMGRKTWEKLTPQEQEIVRASAEAAKQDKRQRFAEQERQWLDVVREAGMQVNDVTLAERERMAERLAPVIERQGERVGSEFAAAFYAATKKQREAAR